MAVLHRALLSWFLCLVFLILLVIRLDQRTHWNWFIVFIPMWIFDGAVLIYAAFYVVHRCRSSTRNVWPSTVIRKKIEFVAVVGLKLALQIMICLKLEFPQWNLPLYFVLIPLWAILFFVIAKMFTVLLGVALSPDNSSTDNSVSVWEKIFGRKTSKAEQSS